MPYNGASNGSGVGGAVAGSSVSGGGATIVVSEGPQNKKIRTGVQQPGENDVNMHARDVLHKICNPHGQVLRIVIFKKNGVQAMVEFDSLDAATRARENLNGADIYAGCCTLKIDFAKPEKLNVYKNETDTSWDYTLSTGEIQPKPPLLGPGTAFPPFGAPEYHPTQPDNWKGAAIHPTGLMKEPTGVVAGRNAPVAFAQQGQAQGAVMMVYGMDHDTSNTDKLFNLVCLYGNVARIKFLKTKEGTAMVQMGDSVAVERCVQHLNNIPVGTGGKIQIAFSKQNFLSEVINPFLLPDHTPSFKEYTGSKNNRFLSPAQASKNRIQPPSKILHFFNTPPGLTEDQLIGIFNIKEVPATSVRLFPLKTERSSSGLIEFPNISQAVLAIMKCNHLPIEGKGTKFPFIMKLCFSSSKSMNGAWNNAANEGMIEKENDGDIKVEIYN
ncbi:heterogeneous nuclear ribonucleoprotein L isoform X20 [Drosophila sulfurigaster albostrigata]|uniref:Heterogeneous nuclear ribonucleoprotein L isoform X17 n=1 Tax=Drosophila albomicans TaxID=7291 RepID=A0A9C6SYB3_DROAB|nr:heterogeneous nuclear ribonucleoprotein L isoform X17 [Drosophila albomicans]XP_062134831.1 heterogeneous nuclear ribonucleoprotein L isoform X20 [Drosophila sulfurigaster albostrigata]